MSTFWEKLTGIDYRDSVLKIIRNDANLSNGFVGSNKLSPTALLPANWVLWNDGTNFQWVWDIVFSSDTAIEFTFGALGGSNPNYTNGSQTVLGKAGGPGSTATMEAQVLAAPNPANRRPQGGGFCPAGGYLHLLRRSWLSCFLPQGIYVTTSLVAANCYCTFYWAEFQD